MDTLRQEKAYTIEDIYTLPDGERAELIDGKIYYMAPPNTKHQRLVHFFDREIGNYIQNNNGECEVLPAPFAVFLNEDEINYVEPDISVICDRDKITDKGCNGAPDWIVDPTREVVTVYRFEKETMEQYSFGEDIPVGLYEDFSIKVE